MKFTEKDILKELDLAFNDEPSSYFPKVNQEDVQYNFFLDLEHGYFETAGNQIHLYADKKRWAIVFEKNGYQNRSMSAEIELNYVGNCIDYSIKTYEERNYISNTNSIVLIKSEEFERIENQEGAEMETFEFIGENVTDINIRDKKVAFVNDYRQYEAVGVQIEEEDNPKRRIGFADLIRYLSEVNTSIICATEEEIKRHIPHDLQKIMTIDKFHYQSTYDSDNLPSKLETYQLIAKILVERDLTYWQPTLAPNNHWSNWESGHL